MILQTIIAPSVLGLVLIASSHLLIRWLTSIKRIEGILLDSAAGIAVAYAFVDVFPHLASAQAKLPAYFVTGPYAYLAHHAYLVALVGFMVYLGVRTSLDESRGPTSAVAARMSPQLIVMFAFILLYNFLVGYMLAEQPTHRYEPALVFALAMTAHFIGMNHEHRASNPELYDRWFKYAYIVALTLGWVTGLFFELSDTAFGLWFAFLAGGIISTGLSTELPRIQSLKSFVTFVLGSAAFTVAILVVEGVKL